MLAGEHAQAADQRAEQRHADDDRRTRKDVDDGAGDGGGAGGIEIHAEAAGQIYAVQLRQRDALLRQQHLHAGGHRCLCQL